MERAVLQNDYELPAVRLALVKGRPPGEQTVHRQRDRQPWDADLEPFCQSIEGLELTVLFGRLFFGVLDKLSREREGEAIGGDELKST